jgi:N-carbamoylputrescine amidase
MKRDMKVAALSIPCPGGHVDRVVGRMETLVKRLRAEGVVLFCFPEACLTGYSVGPEVHQWARDLSAPPVRAVREMALRNRVHILAGLMERTPSGAFHLTHLAFSPEGEMTPYRKAHLSPQERRIFTAGDRPGLFPMDRTVGALALCYETHFPEWIARLALLGAELLCFPSASPHESPPEKRERWLRYLPARAYDNSAFAVACNQAGENGAGLTFPGVSLVIDPKGRVLAAAEGEEEAVAVATLNAGEISRVQSHPMANFLANRRPELYGDIGGQETGVRSQNEEDRIRNSE